MKPQRSAPARPLYDRVEQIRATRGWSKTRLSRETGIARSTFDKWKTQPRGPLAETVVSVADKLAIDRDEALRLAGIISDGSQDEPALPPEFADDGQLQGLLDKLPPEMRRQALENAEIYRRRYREDIERLVDVLNAQTEEDDQIRRAR